MGCESPVYGLQKQAIHDLLDILLSITAWRRSVRNFRTTGSISLLTPNLPALLYYDHIITLPLEIRYIWNDTTTLTSTVFLLNRYIMFSGYIAYSIFYFGLVGSGNIV